MARKYEFNIEEINEVSIQDISADNNYTVTYTRKFIGSEPTKTFITTFNALADIDTDGNIISSICGRCGSWYSGEVCEECTDEYEYLFTEEELIEEVLGFFTEDIFFNSYIEINGTHIK